MIAERDMEACRAAIRTGSLSFHAASRLLPSAVRDPALALYAFCRLADDAVDEGDDKTGAVLRLHDRLDRVYAGRPVDAAADRAFAAVVEGFEMPRALPDALLEGMAWDAVGRRYDDLSGVLAYAARVAAAVGAMMCVLMRVRDGDALARACDLGLAMQLTNIARDVGEDARAGRVYLPLGWLAEAGVPLEPWLNAPVASAGVRRVVRRLLAEAERLYVRSEAGVGALPMGCRPGIFAARLIYDGIGAAVRRGGYDSVGQRARTTKAQKIGWLGLAVAKSAAVSVMPRGAVLHAPPVPEVAFLVQAAARAIPSRGRSDALLGVLAQLEARDRGLSA
ncbi:MAG: phytoene/squalene synthase family protein [Tabrizicola sp.]|uniref:15-cis-phytoene synthase n=1 Tax=Tabrizicola sp. TaxID=2005166 RepID=UPI0027364AF2|nr:phytoene/squalene synthase family protein [Tabrizicola sp.]MDP3265129.1 phytoene/squalene synthase family protein [Tabrizicola sp.]MDP3646897.1 phytoene/squalene synthase family protein [Paracoccaceae bacterium]MDZ4068250.1 phytoene/squalene synthase family protein [Tabrizicola sp.]